MVTGIVNNLNTQPFTEEEYEGKQYAMLTHDKQTVNGSFYFGMSLLVPACNLIETFHAPEENADIIKTWCVKMKPRRKRTLQLPGLCSLGVERQTVPGTGGIHQPDSP